MTTFKHLLCQDELTKLKNSVKKDKPAVAPARPTTPKTTKASKVMDDGDLFKQAMAGVTPIKNRPTITKPVQKDPNAALKRALLETDTAPLADGLSDMKALLDPVASEAFLSYKIPTLPKRAFDQLKAGKLPYTLAVDLHGTTTNDAKDAILTLIHMAENENQTVVKIVHGKGVDGLLKTYINGWLKQLPQVLAFVSAPNKMGGTGAVLVLLKKQKTTDNF